MFKMKFVGLITLVLLLTGCVGNKEYQLLQTKSTDTEIVKVSDRSIEYRILAQDRLEVSLYKDPAQGSESLGSNELGQSMNANGLLVDAAGYVNLPLIGKIKLAGLSQTQAADRITTKYEKYLNTPTVYVEVLNKRLFVLGEVKNPGVVKIDKEKMTLFEALATAGDLTDSAVRTEIVILSNSPKKGMQMRTVDLTNFDKMNYASLMLRPNDIVYVKPNDWKAFRVASDDYTAPLETITKIAAPFVTMKYLFE
ncbi:MAG: polysaccharide biosynthesis/export family protein [Sulfurovum sp.]|nr:polysaccharide biosynthesis/export family protein [Sulfurovum sp.]